MSIHPSSIVSAKAELGRNVSIGPFCLIGDDVVIGDDCVLKSHVVIEGRTELGKRNVVAAFGVLGGDAQHIRAKPGAGKLVVGDDNIIREGCKIHRGADLGDAGPGGRDADHTTRIGKHNFIMGNVHMAHDSSIGDHNIITNNSSLGGHVALGNYVIIGGHTAVHQFCRIGDFAFTGRAAVIVQDLPPYLKAAGNNLKVHGVNTLALQRNGWSQEAIGAVKKLYKIFYRQSETVAEAMEHPQVQELYSQFSEVAYFVDFVRSSRRGIC